MIQRCWLFCRWQEGVFTNLHQLKKLSLIHNSISSIELHVFDESANLSSLSTINLGDNAITELEPWPVIRAQHRPMTVILRHNRITKFTNALRWSFNCNSTKIFDSQLDIHDNEIQHFTDAINGWNIDGRLSQYIFGFLDLSFIELGRGTRQQTDVRTDGQTDTSAHFIMPLPSSGV